MPEVIVTHHDIALMNSVAKVFHNSYPLLYRYHNTKNVRSRVKLAVGKKQIKGEYIITFKASVIEEIIKNAWTVIINYSTKELYDNAILQFRRVCEKYLGLLKYFESTILYQVKENVACAWTDQVRHLGNTTT